MDAERCLELLELEACASAEEARRAYRDLVRVWHPDRFAGDPRLRLRAEEKVKQLNRAYEDLIGHLERAEGKRGGTGAFPGEDRSASSSGSATEAFFEAGTRTVLTLWQALHRTLREAVQEARRDMTKDGTRKNRP